MRRYLIYAFAALIAVIPPVFGQDPQDEQPKAQSTSTEQTPDPASTAPARQVPRAAPSPKGYGYRPTQKRTPAAQYSPLAAAGGYGHSGVTPWQAIVNYFNPHHLNMGQLFAERKQTWLDNALYNQYFWYSFWATGLLILSWFAIAWIHNDRHRATWELAECASDALRYSEYCKREAKEAIRRHNDHIEKCNRITEDRRSGLLTTPGTANLEDLNEQIKSLTSDKQANEFQIARLDSQLKAKEASVAEITTRLNQLENQLLTSGNNRTPATETSAAGLVERINRLENENRNLREDNRRMRQQSKASAVSAVNSPGAD
jgi:hypothetical protein